MKKGILALLLVFAISASAETYTSNMNYTSTNTSNSNTSTTTNNSRASSTSTDTQNSYTVDSKTKTYTNTKTPTSVKYNLVVNKGGTGSGKVESKQANITFGNVAKVSKGTKVTLKAVPVAGSKFSSWGGACFGVLSNTCTITLSKDKAVLANFKAEVKALNNSNLKAADSDCAINAITKRDNAIISNMTQHNQRLVDAINARKAGQIAAFGKDATARVKAIKAANESYSKAQENINKQIKDNRGAIISTYRSEMKVCGIEDNETN